MFQDYPVYINVPVVPLSSRYGYKSRPLPECQGGDFFILHHISLSPLLKKMSENSVTLYQNAEKQVL